MNIRKITHNRRRKRIGNLVTGVLNHFGKSTEENLTETVLNYSTQPREYVEFAVRRTLNCGVRQGFLVKTGRNTFDVPRHPCETDSCKSEKPKEQYYECLQKQEQHSNTCMGRDLISNQLCTNKAHRGQCYFHKGLATLYNYAIDFVKKIDEPDTRKILQNYYEHYEIKLKAALDDTNVPQYKTNLENFFRKVKQFYCNGKENQNLMDIFSKPIQGPDGTQCNGIQISGDKYEERCKKNSPCSEHDFYEEVLGGFSRDVYNRGFESRVEHNESKAISFADRDIATNLLKKNDSMLGTLTNVNPCVYDSFALITRYHRLRITGKSYLKDYDDTLFITAREANKNGCSCNAGNCICLNLPAIYEKFGTSGDWPELEYLVDEEGQPRRRKNPPVVSVWGSASRNPRSRSSSRSESRSSSHSESRSKSGSSRKSPKKSKKPRR